MAVNYLTGNEQPTAAKMNQLWAEADAVVAKAMDGKSLWFLQHLVGSNYSAAMGNQARLDNPWRGIQFWIWSPIDHLGGTTQDRSFLYGMHVFSGVGNLPAAYNESTIDTAIASATIGASDTTNQWAQSSSGDDIMLNRSLKTHTTTVGVTTCLLWDYDEPSPDKAHKWAVAEIQIETHSGSYTLADSADKYNFFKIHNLKNQALTFNFGSNYSVSIAAWEQVCVRRDTVSSGYDSTYKYFFKCKKDDPRWLYFDSHGGLATTARISHSSIYQSMRANNVTNASFLHSLMDALAEAHLIDFNQHDLLNDVTTEYYNAGVIPADPRLSTGTRVADLVYTKGKIGVIKRATSGGTQTAATVDFAGTSTLGTILSPYSITVSASGNNINLAQTSDYILILYGLETNLFTWDDRFRAPELGASGAAYLIKTEFVKFAARASNHVPKPHYYIASAAAYSDSTTTVAQAITAFDGVLESWVTGSSAQAVLTTEGPILKWLENWDYGPAATTVWPIEEMFHLQINTGGGLDMQTFWPLGFSTDGTSGFRNGWPHGAFQLSHQQSGIDAAGYFGRHRLFEGPRKSRRYEDSSTHNDFTGDPVAPGGAGVTQGDIGTLTDTSIKAQSCDFNMIVPAFTAGSTSTAQMPRLVPNDALLDLETNKTDTTWTNSNVAGIRTANGSGDWSGFGGNNYLRMNLLKEHFNDLARPLKAARRFAPFNINKIGFPVFPSPLFEEAMPTGRQMLITPSTNGESVLPIDAWVGWYAADTSYNTPYTDLFTAFGVTIFDKDDMADTWDDLTIAPWDGTSRFSTTIRADFKWVKTVDVLAAALAYNFKVKRLSAYIPLEFEKADGGAGPVGRWGFKPVSSGAGYKQPVSPTRLCGATFWNYADVDYANYGQQWMPIDRQSGLNGYSAYYIEAIDTSNTGSTKATCVSQVVEDSGGAVTGGAVTNSVKTSTTFYLTAPAADEAYRVCIKPTDGVTHTA